MQSVASKANVEGIQIGFDMDIQRFERDSIRIGTTQN
jgi:hypothetical protein